LGVPWAAHEKIASDLARIIGVPVPPVILWQAPDNANKFAISAFAFKQALTWGQFLPSMSDVFKDNALNVLAAGHVFHTWICDKDHFNHGGNLLVDGFSTDIRPGLAFIDHACSMSNGWTTKDHPCLPLGSYYLPTFGMPKDVVAHFVKKVQEVPSVEIRRIVRRIAVDFLPVNLADVIEDCLLSRQNDLAAAYDI
jgi:hypothetical protein